MGLDLPQYKLSSRESGLKQVVRVDIGAVIYEAMTPKCGRPLVQVLVVRVDIGVVIYEAMTPQCGRSVVQVLVIRVDIAVVISEAMTPNVKVLVVRVNIGVLIYETMISHCQWFRSLKMYLLMYLQVKLQSAFLKM